VLGLAVACSAAAEPDGAALVRSQRCYPCHDQTRYLIGPSWEAIAARHAAHKDVMAGVLAEKIRIGGGGNWGVVPMVPNEHVTGAQARIIADWILGLEVSASAR
jgi:cytochrome c